MTAIVVKAFTIASF